MIKPVKMPDLGTTVDEVRIIKWFKKEGEYVKRGEPLLEIETDKASMEVEAFIAGYIKKILASEDDMVQSGSIVAYIADDKDELSLPDDGKANEAVESEIRISPMIRNLAKRLGVEIQNITGSGPGGLITREDVISAKGSTESQPKNEVVPFNRITKAMAKAMSLSKSTIPHVYFSTDVDATEMIEARKTSDRKISYNAIIIAKITECLKQFPDLASRYSDEGMIRADLINIGLAVAKDKDLIVPVIRQSIVEKGVEQIEDEIKRLVDAVGSGQIKEEDISSGVFTLSNLGAYGIDSFTAVINPPEAAILAVAAIKDRAVAENGAVVIKKMFTMTLSVDHRMVSGVYAAGFLSELKTKLERMRF